MGTEPVWIPRQSQATALLQVVLRAGEHGLDPELFHVIALKDPAALPPIDRDLLLSDAFLAYADALARGVLPVELRMDDEDLKPEPVDAAVALETAIASPECAGISGAAPCLAVLPERGRGTGKRARAARRTGAASGEEPRCGEPGAQPDQGAAGRDQSRTLALAAPLDAGRPRLGQHRQ